MTVRRQMLFVVTLTVVAGGVMAGLSYRQIAIWSVLERRAVTTRSAEAIETLTRAYLATPNDATTAAHLRWSKGWIPRERHDGRRTDRW